MKKGTYLRKIKGSDVLFKLETIGDDFPGQVKQTLYFRSEAELREFFTNGRPGLTQGEIESTIENAKEE